MSSPYVNLPKRQFWKHGVLNKNIDSIKDIYTKRFSIEGLRIATAGSCFAQHIATNLRAAGYDVVDREPAPRNVRKQLAQKYGYGLYSARHGNIYTARRLLQLTEEAMGIRKVKPRVLVWQKDDRFVDALRPQVEPNGLETIDEVLAQRSEHLKKFIEVLTTADLFVFTFGLTEAWLHKGTGLVYSLTPGASGGRYIPKVHEFRNFTFQEIYEDFVRFRKLAQSLRPRRPLKFLLTVSPVPLVATAEDRHVLVSTVYSKSVLRAVAGQLYNDFPDVDYFPSYELISTPFLGPDAYEADKRNVTADGVASVMKVFFSQHPPLQRLRPASVEDVVCEEVLLEAFD